MAKKKSIKEVLCENTQSSDSTVKSYFSEINPPDTCAICGCGCIHNNFPLVLQLDHINGDHSDSRPENLRWVCPNCHTQTDTYCGRNTWNVVNISDEEIIDALETCRDRASAMRRLKMDTGRTEYWARVSYIVIQYNVEIGKRLNGSATSYTSLFLLE